MKDQLVSFEVAKLAKEKGFKESSTGCYDSEGNFEGLDMIDDLEFTQDHIEAAAENDYNMYLAPTQSLLQKWLREIKDIDVIVNIFGDFSPYGYILFISKDEEFHGRKFNTYEEALEEGLKEALKML